MAGDLGSLDDGDGTDGQRRSAARGRLPWAVAIPRQKSWGAILIQNGILELSKRGFGERS